MHRGLGAYGPGLLAMPQESLRLTRQLLKRPLMAGLQAAIRQQNLLFVERLNNLEAQQR